jgi:cellobiose-specific phosphotransferase system component IIC
VPHLHGDVSGFIYLPFLRAYERSLMKTEEKSKK